MGAAARRRARPVARRLARRRDRRTVRGGRALDRARARRAVVHGLDGGTRPAAGPRRVRAYGLPSAARHAQPAGAPRRSRSRGSGRAWRSEARTSREPSPTTERSSTTQGAKRVDDRRQVDQLLEQGAGVGHEMPGRREAHRDGTAPAIGITSPPPAGRPVPGPTPRLAAGMPRDRHHAPCMSRDQHVLGTPPAARGLTGAEAAQRLAARGKPTSPPSSRSYASIVRANTVNDSQRDPARSSACSRSPSGRGGTRCFSGSSSRTSRSGPFRRSAPSGRWTDSPRWSLRRRLWCETGSTAGCRSSKWWWGTSSAWRPATRWSPTGPSPRRTGSRWMRPT